MKVLITVNTYEPRHDGVQAVTKYLAEGLVNKGHEVDLITHYSPDRTKIRDEIINGVHVIRWNAWTKYTIHHGNKDEYLNKLIRNDEHYDCLVNIGTQTPYCDWILPVIDKINIPKVLYIHSIWDFKYHKQYFQNFSVFAKKTYANIRWWVYYNRWGKAFRQYDRVIQLHEKDYSYLWFKKKYGIDSVIIENAADDSFFDSDVDATIHVPKKYFINVANYDDRKNQKEILKAFLQADTDSYELILIGSEKNDYYERIADLYKNYKANGGSKNVQLLFDVPRKNISTYVKKASVYVMASRWEAFPISLTESMSAGVPWISSDVGIVKYLPGGVVYGNKTLSETMSSLVHDDTKRISLGIQGRHYAEKKFRKEDKINQFEKCINDAINNYNKAIIDEKSARK